MIFSKKFYYLFQICFSLINNIGISSNFNSKMLLCGWHIQRNLVSKLSGLAKRNKEIYNLILSLPFITSESKFTESVNKIKNAGLTNQELDYINLKLKTKTKWAKSYTKSVFCGGVSTTSRVEGLHGILKKHLNSNSNLQKVFSSFRHIEKSQLDKFCNEYNRHTIKGSIIDTSILKSIEEEFPTYIYKKIFPKFSKALAYVAIPDENSAEW